MMSKNKIYWFGSVCEGCGHAKVCCLANRPSSPQPNLIVIQHRFSLTTNHGEVGLVGAVQRVPRQKNHCGSCWARQSLQPGRKETINQSCRHAGVGPGQLDTGAWARSCKQAQHGNEPNAHDDLLEPCWILATQLNMPVSTKKRLNMLVPLFARLIPFLGVI